MSENPGANVRELIKSVVERIGRLQEEKKGLGDDIADIYREAKSSGLDAKALRVVVRLRGQDPAARKEQAALVETYMQALGTVS
jgi:uncharacterized protein (UPF0335 family)